MEFLTVQFVQLLYQAIRSGDPPLAQRLLERTREELLQSGAETAALAARCLPLSPRAKAALDEFAAWQRQTEAIQQPLESEELLQRLQECQREFERLSQETSAALRCPGVLRPEELHLLPPEALSQSCRLLRRQAETAMCRLLAFGGTQPLGIESGVPAKLETLLPEDAIGLLTVCRRLLGLLTAAPSEWKVPWAMRRSICALGVRASLPVWLPCAPPPEARNLLPGELWNAQRGQMILGLGRACNVTPLNLEQALREGIAETLTPGQVYAVLKRWPKATPPEILSSMTASWYTIDPGQLADALNTAEAALELERRRAGKRCLLCGQAGWQLCSSCQERLDILW